MQIYKGEFDLLDVLGFEYEELLDTYIMQVGNGFFVDIHKASRHVAIYSTYASKKTYNLDVLIELVLMGLIIQEEV